jgi:hypothetical protein
LSEAQAEEREYEEGLQHQLASRMPHAFKFSVPSTVPLSFDQGNADGTPKSGDDMKSS